MTKTKVLLSVDDEELKEIDEKAAAAGMSRSAYLVAMGRQGPVRIYDAIQTLHDELGSFLARDEVAVNREFLDEVVASFQRLVAACEKAANAYTKLNTKMTITYPAEIRAEIGEWRDAFKALATAVATESQMFSVSARRELNKRPLKPKQPAR